MISFFSCINVLGLYSSSYIFSSCFDKLMNPCEVLLEDKFRCFLPELLLTQSEETQDLVDSTLSA